MATLLTTLLYYTALICSIAACGSHSRGSHTDTPTSTETEQLQSRYDLYLAQPQPHQDQNTGWYLPDMCDALLFVSLQAVGSNQEIQLDTARQDGIWYRNPNHGGCGTGDTSRDMFLGVILYSVKFGRLDYLEQIWSYGQAHNWKMGQGDERTVLLPWDIGLLARSIRKLGGANHPETNFSLPLKSVPGFINHLQILSILINGTTEGGLSPTEVDFLKQMTSEMPHNPFPHAVLHRYTDGDQSGATELLLRTWPGDRLPDSRDWCDEWIIQRDMNSPDMCPEGVEKKHTGGDFLFVSRIILNWK